MISKLKISKNQKTQYVKLEIKFFGFLFKILNILLCRGKSIFLYKPYFGSLRVIIHLILKLKQFPILYPSFLEKYFSNEKISLEKRIKLKNFKSKNEIEKKFLKNLYIYLFQNFI